MRVLIACEFSGIVRDAFSELGHDAWSCDLLPTERPGKHIQGDVLEVINDGWDLMVAHPPCTRLTNSGVRWLHVAPPDKTLCEMWEAFEDAVEFYKALRNAPITKKAIENPIMHCHARSRLGYIKRQVVQPWWFGDAEFKGVGFELFNLPELVPTDILTPPLKDTEEYKEWMLLQNEPPSEDRWKNRSRTHIGIAKAMAFQWGTGLKNGTPPPLVRLRGH